VPAARGIREGVTVVSSALHIPPLPVLAAGRYVRVLGGLCTSGASSQSVFTGGRTCLTVMYVSTAEDRAEGYGLPSRGYRELYSVRDTQAPLQRSQFWMAGSVARWRGRYGRARWSSRSRTA